MKYFLEKPDFASMRVSTEIQPESLLIQQTVDIFGEQTRTFYNVVAEQRDAAIREVLIRLGWTPPPDNLQRGEASGENS